MEEWVALAKELGLQGKDLANFMRDEREAQREKLKREQEHKMKLELIEKEVLEEKLKREQEHKMKVELIDKEKEMKHLEIEQLKARSEASIASIQEAQALQAQGAVGGKAGTTPKFPYFDEVKDDVDVYLKRFERHARLHNWPDTQWAQHLGTLLRSSKAAEVCTWVPDEKEGDYQALKVELLKRFGFTANDYREKFRNSTPWKGEGFSQYITRLSAYADRWLELDKVVKTYDALRQTVIMEQIYNRITNDLKGHLKEHKPVTVTEFCKVGEGYLDARGRLYEGWGSKTPTVVHSSSVGKHIHVDKGAKVEKPSVKKRCHKCGSLKHLKFECKEGPEYRWLGGERKCHFCKSDFHLKDKCKAEDLNKSQYRSQTSTSRVSVAVEEPNPSVVSVCISESGLTGKTPCCGKEMPVNEDGLVCLEVEGKTKEMVLLCSPVVFMKKEQMPDNMPVKEGRMNDVTVQVLRDTGCSTAVVKKSLCKPESFTGRFRTCWGVHGRQVTPTVVVDIDSPYFSGRVEALAVSNPPYDVLIGNNLPGVRGSHEPDENWEPQSKTSTVNIKSVVIRAQKQQNVKPEKLFMKTNATGKINRAVDCASSITVVGDVTDNFVEQEMCGPIGATKMRNNLHVQYDTLLASNQVEQVRSLLPVYEFQDVITDIPGKTDSVKGKMVLTSTQPAVARQSPLPEKIEIRMGDMGIIEPSNSNQVIGADVTKPQVGKVYKPKVLVGKIERESTFNRFKVLEKETVLKLPDPEKMVILCVDAPKTEVGGVLMQEWGGAKVPVMCVSRKLNGAEMRHSAIERECVALVWCVKRLHVYLCGKKFSLVTDQQPLLYMNKTNIDNARVTKWALALQIYGFIVQIAKAVNNEMADCWSRCGIG